MSSASRDRRALLAAVSALIVTVLLATLSAATAMASFGIVAGSLHAEALNRDGSVDAQAGSHPYAYNVRFTFNHDAEGHAEGSVRDIIVDLPPGFAGNPISTPRCTRPNLEGFEATCPGNTQIGTFAVESSDPATKTQFSPAGPIYNLVPPKGDVASFGFAAAGFNAFQDISLIRQGGEEKISVATRNLPLGHIVNVSVTIWGVPEDPSHDAERLCVATSGEFIKGCPSDAPQRPFIALPGHCGTPLLSILEADPTEAPGSYLSESAFSQDAGGNPLGLVGCEAIDFKPSILVAPEKTTASTPTGLHVDVHIPQEESVGGLAEAQLRSASVTLPPGLVVNPSSANGLQSCSPSEIELESSSPPSCPDASQIGTVEVDTPVLDHPLPGVVYLASQNENPFHSLVAIYVVINDRVTGTIVKLAGHVEPDLISGQLRTTFSELPQLPFEDVKLDLIGGPRAPLMTPATCSTNTTLAQFTSWAAPEAAPPVDQSSASQVLAGPGGGACAFSEAQEPNQPSLEAGTTIPLAGSYSPFVLKLTREDGSQNLQSISVTLPPGLVGKLAGIPRCSDAEIAAAQAAGRTGHEEQSNPSCPAASRLGTATSGLGAGSSPLYISAPAYLAGPYRGAPFSMVVIVPAVAGPFDLGVVLIRSALYVNPETAQVTAKTDPLPSILDGFPTDIRSVNVVLDRPEFVLNPTSCEAKTIGGEAVSTLGQIAPLAAHFQVGGCAGLPFNPIFSVSTKAKTSKRNGASLTVKVTQKAGEANIHKAILQLPLALPARLTTLQKACLAAQFAANPAGCPEGSNIGTARAVTPILGVPLAGPAYLVSHGGAKFPDVVFILQGEGVVVNVVAHTEIKAGITSSRLESVPDAPISSFEANFPEGPHSILSAFGELCAKSLSVLVTTTAQSGALSKHPTPISVTGCPKPSIKVSKVIAAKSGLNVSLRISQPGAVRISGRALRATRESLSAGTHTVHVNYSAIGRALRRAHRTTRIKLRLTGSGGVRQVVVSRRL